MTRAQLTVTRATATATMMGRGFPEIIDTDLTLADVAGRNFPIYKTMRGTMPNSETRECHFAPFDSGCSAGEILPVDLEHPANAVLCWAWYK